MLDTQTEQVLVVPTSLFHSLGHFQGFSRDVQGYVQPLLSPENTSYRPRAEVEQDPGFKQLIPYVIFRHTDPKGGEHLFSYVRGKGQGEGRLHSKRSIGIGGHISSEDSAADGQASYAAGMRREVSEELIVSAEYTERCVGLINDDETEVGRVHLGIVHIVDLDQPLIQPREADIIDCGFWPIRDLVADLAHFESWSQICLRSLFGAG